MSDYIRIITTYPSYFIPDLFLLISLGTGLWALRYLNVSGRVVFSFMVLTLLIDILMTHYAAHNQNNHFLVNLASLFEMTAFSFFFQNEIRNIKVRRIIHLLFTLYLAVFVYTFVWHKIMGHTLGLERGLLIIYVLLYFRHLLNEMRVHNLLIHSEFWISIGVLTYAAGTLFIYTFDVFASSIKEPNRFYWLLNFQLFFSSVLYITAGISFWLKAREVKLGIV